MPNSQAIKLSAMSLASSRKATRFIPMAQSRAVAKKKDPPTFIFSNLAQDTGRWKKKKVDECD